MILYTPMYNCVSPSLLNNIPACDLKCVIKINDNDIYIPGCLHALVVMVTPIKIICQSFSLKHPIPVCDLKCVNGGLDSEHCKCICYKDFTGKICNGECLEC